MICPFHKFRQGLYKKLCLPKDRDAEPKFLIEPNILAVRCGTATLFSKPEAGKLVVQKFLQERCGEIHQHFAASLRWNSSMAPPE